MIPRLPVKVMSGPPSRSLGYLVTSPRPDRAKGRAPAPVCSRGMSTSDGGVHGGFGVCAVNLVGMVHAFD
jgi:hypothetical protein